MKKTTLALAAIIVATICSSVAQAQMRRPHACGPQYVPNRFGGTIVLGNPECGPGHMQWDRLNRRIARQRVVVRRTVVRRTVAPIVVGSAAGFGAAAALGTPGGGYVAGAPRNAAECAARGGTDTGRVCSGYR
ncbi:MAG TPA: hypothetical protein VHD38_03085 [Candidatus Paceibacterota bacterium]|nr:hypothetical protein [Candidatus Paceibacterota bacterium]